MGGLRRVAVFGPGSAPGTPSGYGQQSMFVVRALHRAGYRVKLIHWSAIAERRPADVGRNLGVGAAAMAKHPRVAATRVSVDNSSPGWNEEQDSYGVEHLVSVCDAWPGAIPKRELNRLLERERADLFVGFQDSFLFEPGPFACRAVLWCPVHFFPLEDQTLRELVWWDDVVPLTRYGQRFLARELSDAFGSRRGPRLVLHDPVAHGRPAERFRPAADRAEVRAARRALKDAIGLDLPERAEVTLVVAANTEPSNRKCFDAQIQAWARYAKHAVESAGRGGRGGARSPRSPRSVHLHIQTNPAGAFDVLRILHMEGLHPDYPREAPVDASAGVRVHRGAAQVPNRNHRVTDRVSWSIFNYTDEHNLALVYRASDVLLAASASEGFGVPIVEAQLSGVPVVTNATTAMTELTVLGKAVAPSAWTMRADFNAGWWLPDVAGVARALEDLHHARRPSEAAVRTAVEEVRRRYAEPAILEGWDRVLATPDRPTDLRLRGRALARRSTAALRRVELAAQTIRALEAELAACLGRLSAVELAATTVLPTPARRVHVLGGAPPKANPRAEDAGAGAPTAGPPPEPDDAGAAGGGGGERVAAAGPGAGGPRDPGVAGGAGVPAAPPAAGGSDPGAL